MRPVALTTALGEVMAPPPVFGPTGPSGAGPAAGGKTGGGVEPGVLVTALILSPEGRISVEPGALHGRSELESSLRFVQRRDQLADPAAYWFVWVAVELDGAQRPLRYKGVAASELLVNRDAQAGYKSVAENVNRMSEAMRGSVNLKTLDARAKSLIREQLTALGSEVWERSAPAFKEAVQ